jgi:hypothetical protein
LLAKLATEGLIVTPNATEAPSWSKDMGSWRGDMGSWAITRFGQQVLVLLRTDRPSNDDDVPSP